MLGRAGRGRCSVEEVNRMAEREFTRVVAVERSPEEALAARTRAASAARPVYLLFTLGRQATRSRARPL
jgi:hypothetical protein